MLPACSNHLCASGISECDACKIDRLKCELAKANEHGELQETKLHNECQAHERTKHELAEAQRDIMNLYAEVDCRVQHGANSGGHLEYVHARLQKMLGLVPGGEAKP